MVFHAEFFTESYSIAQGMLQLVFGNSDDVLINFIGQLLIGSVLFVDPTALKRYLGTVKYCVIVEQVIEGVYIQSPHRFYL